MPRTFSRGRIFSAADIRRITDHMFQVSPGEFNAFLQDFRFRFCVNDDIIEIDLFDYFDFIRDSINSIRNFLPSAYTAPGALVGSRFIAMEGETDVVKTKFVEELRRVRQQFPNV